MGKKTTKKGFHIDPQLGSLGCEDWEMVRVFTSEKATLTLEFDSASPLKRKYYSKKIEGLTGKVPRLGYF